MTARLASQIRVRPCGEGFAFGSIVVDGWSISGIRIRGPVYGDCLVDWRVSESKGTRYPVATPPPGIRDRLEQEIVAAYEAVTGRRR
jgi:hypothetical protein